MNTLLKITARFTLTTIYWLLEYPNYSWRSAWSHLNKPRY